MNNTKDIHTTNWHSIVTAAQMCRVQRPNDCSETITIPKEVFDDLVQVAAAAAKLQHAARPPKEIVLHRHENHFSATVFDPITSSFTVTESTLFQTLSSVNDKIHAVIESHLR